MVRLAGYIWAWKGLLGIQTAARQAGRMRRDFFLPFEKVGDENLYFENKVERPRIVLQAANIYLSFQLIA